MNKEKNYQLGIVVSVIGGLMGILGHFLIFQNWYFRGMAAESAEEGCEILLKYLHPALTDLGILAGVLFLVAGFGFYLKQHWAWVLSVLAIVFALQSTWFINVPYMAAGLPPIYFSMFFPYLILYFVLLRGVGKEPWNKTLIAMLAGLTFILTFMNGVSSLSRIITIGAPIFVMTQRLHWIAMVGCGVVTVGMILKPRQWMWVTGITACMLELVVGIPLALFTMRELGRFSLFSLAPIGCLIFLIVLLWPGVWDGIKGVEKQIIPDGSPEPA